MSVIVDNLCRIKNKVEEAAAKNGVDSSYIKIVAVSKTRSLHDVQDVMAAGHSIFGENTIQDALTKIPELKKSQIEWHFIGHLQSKKTKHIPGNFQWLHTLDSLKLAEKLSGAVLNSKDSIPINTLIQVNITEKNTQSGVLCSELNQFIETILERHLTGIKLRGFMVIGVQGDQRETRKVFSELKKLQQQCQKNFSLDDFDQLSMGMSDDFEVGIEEGATIIRVGTAIFGERTYSA